MILIKTILRFLTVLNFHFQPGHKVLSLYDTNPTMNTNTLGKMDSIRENQPCFQKGDQKCPDGLSISVFIKRNNPTIGRLVIDTMPPQGESSSHEKYKEMKNNQGPTMSKTPQKCLKHQIPYYHSLTDWLLGATIGNHEHSVMDCQWL